MNMITFMFICICTKNSIDMTGEVHAIAKCAYNIEIWSF